MNSREAVRVPLGVEAFFSPEGNLRPLAIVFSGERYQIDKIIGIRSRCPRSVGCVAPVEYTVLIGNNIKQVYYEYDSNSWFSVK